MVSDLTSDSGNRKTIEQYHYISELRWPFTRNQDPAKQSVKCEAKGSAVWPRAPTSENNREATATVK